MTDHPITTDEELIKEIESLKDHMIAVSTGGFRPSDRDTWPDEERKYAERLRRIREALQAREISDTNPHEDLMAWYGKWSGGDLPTYHSRRQYVSELLDPLIEAVRRGRTRVFEEPTGWDRVDRELAGTVKELKQANSESDFLAVGKRCHEVLISLAQEVYDPDQHPTNDNVSASNADAKRMLEAYLQIELSGGSNMNKAARKQAIATVEFSTSLYHKRTATFRDAALCAEATTSIVNMIAILSGRRGP